MSELEMVKRSLQKHNISQQYLQLGGPWNPRSIIATSCKFVHFTLQCQPYDVGRPLVGRVTP